jgi:hypothetical protein
LIPVVRGEASGSGRSTRRWCSCARELEGGGGAAVDNFTGEQDGLAMEQRGKGGTTAGAWLFNSEGEAEEVASTFVGSPTWPATCSLMRAKCPPVNKEREEKTKTELVTVAA